MDKRNLTKLFREDTEEDKNMLHVKVLRDIRMNPNNFSFWFPLIRGLRYEKMAVPESFVVDIPDNVYVSFFNERDGDTKRISDWYCDCVYPVIEENFSGKDFFIKNGCFSNKFEFDNSCHILKDDEGEDVLAKIMNLMYMSLYNDTGGYLELVLREWITPPEQTKTIYGGMPFRPEMRVFYDFDQKKVLYTVNYWDWDYCHDAICQSWDGEKKPDADVYENEYCKENRMVEVWGEQHLPMIAEALSTVNLRGRWSVDFILEEKRVILIDMALARQSAYWDESKIK